MLLNEFLKEHGKVEEQSAEMGKQRSKITALLNTVSQLQSALKAQSALIQEARAQVQAREDPPRLVATP